jgi:hypothetical protein
MTQPKYIVLHKWFGSRPRQIDLQNVYYPEITKPFKTLNIPGLGTIQKVKGTGRYKHGFLSLVFSRAGTAVTIAASHDAIKATIRIMRDDEAAKLDALDAQIAELHGQRDALLADAWAKGHAVTVKELTAIADQNEDAAIARRKDAHSKPD